MRNGISVRQRAADRQNPRARSTTCDSKGLFILSVFKRLPFFTIITGLSLAIGLLIPTVFEFGEKRAARSRHPEMEFVAFLTLLVTLVITVIVWFWKRPESRQTNDDEIDITSASRIQFGIRHVLVATTLVAALLAAAPVFDLPEPMLFWMIGMVLVAILVWTGLQTASVRSRMGATLAGMFLPFAWIVPYSKPFGYSSGLLSAILFGPGVLPAVFLKGHIDNSIWIATLFVMLELGVGIWLARRGGKLALIYTWLILCLSTVSAFGFHALYRM